MHTGHCKEEGWLLDYDIHYNATFNIFLRYRVGVLFLLSMELVDTLKATTKIRHFTWRVFFILVA